MTTFYFVTWEIITANGILRRFTRSYRDENSARIAYRLKDGPGVTHMCLYRTDHAQQSNSVILLEKRR